MSSLAYFSRVTGGCAVTQWRRRGPLWVERKEAQGERKGKSSFSLDVSVHLNRQAECERSLPFYHVNSNYLEVSN